MDVGHIHGGTVGPVGSGIDSRIVYLGQWRERYMTGTRIDARDGVVIAHYREMEVAVEGYHIRAEATIDRRDQYPQSERPESSRWPARR